ncbi:MAG: hypothetical protein JWO03_3198 [Bacteroidetes bacterium]|nr:hypothetical protein [Bacteroidota bacterium]
MNKIVLLVLIVCCSCATAFSQCTETSVPRVLLVGDSWAFFMNTESTINYALKRAGHSNYTFVSNANLSVNGAETDDVMSTGTENEIRVQLTNNPTIDFVHLSIGGNDFLGSWDTSMTQGQTDTLMMNVFVKLDSVIRFIKSVRPGIKILWSGYCYTNFKESIMTSISPTNHPFYSTWQGMKFPDFHQINTVQNQISKRFRAYCDTTPDIYFVEATGLMQHVFGQTSALGVPPGGTYPVGTAPIDTGFDNYPSPLTTMRDYVIYKDAFHLSTDGYRALLAYHCQKFYQKAMMDDKYLLSDPAQTGSVSQQGVVASTLDMGEAAGDNFSTVLSFNTTAMMDTTLSKASIFLRRKGLTGGNPISGTLEVKVKSGNFGSAATVEAADYSATPDATGTPCLFGSNGANDEWIRLDLPPSILMQINHNAPTQFIISAPGVSASKVQFYDASDSDFAPIMNMKYGQTPNAIREIPADAFSIYPNPTNGQLTITGNEAISKVEVANLLGEIVLHPAMQQQNIDISSLAPGMYVLNITTKSGVALKKVVKD